MEGLNTSLQKTNKVLTKAMIFGLVFNGCLSEKAEKGEKGLLLEENIHIMTQGCY